MTTQSNKKGQQLGQVGVKSTGNSRSPPAAPTMERFGFLGMRRRPATRVQDPKLTLLRKEEHVAVAQ